MLIGIDIGGSSIKAAVLADDLHITARVDTPFPVNSDGGSFFVALTALIDSLCDLDSHVTLCGIGIATAGSLNAARTTIIDAHNLALHDLPLLMLLQERYPGIALALINDADAAALAEYRLGALRCCERAILLTLGTGVGGGLILNGRPDSGGCQRGFEPGHLPLYHGGRLCSCGQRGCAEQYCSATGLVATAREEGLMQEGLDARQVTQLVLAGDAAASRAWKRYRDDLATYLAGLVNLYDPPLIALGGGLSLAGDILFDGLTDMVRERCFFRDCGRIVPALLGNEAGMIGAALMIE